MAKVTHFPTPNQAVLAPANAGKREAFATLGGSASGLFLGHVITEFPPGADPAMAFRKLVDHAFDGVPGLRFGVVMGSSVLA